MEYILAFITTSFFWVIFHMLYKFSNGLYIQEKSKPENRTAMFVRDQFYYIVPEQEYCELQKKNFKAKVAETKVRTVFPVSPEDYE